MEQIECLLEIKGYLTFSGESSYWVLPRGYSVIPGYSFKCKEPTVMLMYSLTVQEADLALCRCEDGVEMALQYAKLWCRYAKDLLAWMEKRISLGKYAAE